MEVSGCVSVLAHLLGQKREHVFLSTDSGSAPTCNPLQSLLLRGQNPPDPTTEFSWLKQQKRAGKQWWRLRAAFPPLPCWGRALWRDSAVVVIIGVETLPVKAGLMTTCSQADIYNMAATLIRSPLKCFPDGFKWADAACCGLQNDTAGVDTQSLKYLFLGLILPGCSRFSRFGETYRGFMLI